MYNIIIIKRNCFQKRKNIVRIMGSENIDDARRLFRGKRNVDSMMSFLLENGSSTKKTTT